MNKKFFYIPRQPCLLKAKRRAGLLRVSLFPYMIPFENQAWYRILKNLILFKKIIEFISKSQNPLNSLKETIKSLMIFNESPFSLG
jgi:hypothetical protein